MAVLSARPQCGCRREWVLSREKSTFVDWQRVKVQELSDEVRPASRHNSPPQHAVHRETGRHRRQGASWHWRTQHTTGVGAVGELKNLELRLKEVLAVPG